MDIEERFTEGLPKQTTISDKKLTANLKLKITLWLGTSIEM